MWSEKYRPKNLETMVGNQDARRKLLYWLGKWKRGSKAALLVGPPGTGKTTTVHLVAEKLGLSLVELNASDVRTKDMLSKKIGEALGSTNLFGQRALLFLDEVDGLAGRSDYGAIDFIKDALKKSNGPVVMSANDPDSDEVRKLRSATNKIEFFRPSPEEVIRLLERISEAQSLPHDPEKLESIARAANGDLRSAINFLQSGLPASKDVELTVTEAVNSFFDASNEKEALRALRAYPNQPRDKIRDLFVAIVRARVHDSRKAEALDMLSRADVVMGHIIKGGNWRLLRYLDPMLASELWRAVGDGGAKYTQDALPWLLQLRVWNDSRKLKDIGSLAGKRLGTSQRGFLVEDMPYFLLLCRDRQFREEAVKSLNLEENYEQFIAKESARASRS